MISKKDLKIVSYLRNDDRIGMPGHRVGDLLKMNTHNLQVKAIEVKGGKNLEGIVSASGSKFTSLLLLTAGLMSDNRIVLKNVPDIEDINSFVDISRFLNVDLKYSVRESLSSITIDASKIKNNAIPPELTTKYHSSYLFLPVLAYRFGECYFGVPGGCKINASRVIPYELNEIFDAFGYEFKIEYDKNMIKIKRYNQHKTFRTFDFSSVPTKHLTVFTKIAMLFSATHKGKTIINNPFMGPEIQDLGHMLNSMGVITYGVGTRLMSMESRGMFKSTEYTIPADWIESLTLLASGLISNGNVTVENIPEHIMGAELAALTYMGAELKRYENKISCKPADSAQETWDNVLLKTGPYPELNTDTHPILAACLTQYPSKSVIVETIWEDRFSYIQELRKMGAKIERVKNMAIIDKSDLVGARVNGRDIRTSAALVLAGLVAKGTTVINNIAPLYRGYENLVSKLKSLGADINEIYS